MPLSCVILPFLVGHFLCLGPQCAGGRVAGYVLELGCPSLLPGRVKMDIPHRSVKDRKMTILSYLFLKVSVPVHVPVLSRRPHPNQTHQRSSTSIIVIPRYQDQHTRLVAAVTALYVDLSAGSRLSFPRDHSGRQSDDGIQLSHQLAPCPVCLRGRSVVIAEKCSQLLMLLSLYRNPFNKKRKKKASRIPCSST